jgi:uncharacterized protein YkwD
MRINCKSLCALTFLAVTCLALTCELRADENTKKGSSSSSAKKVTPLHEHSTLVKMLVRNNELRSQAGLAAQTMSPKLCQAAQDHANYMASTRSFSHYENGSPGSRAQKYGYAGGVRENIAMGYRDVKTTFTGWRNSGGHWASITSNTSKAGFGYAISSSGEGYWVGMYGN